MSAAAFEAHARFTFRGLRFRVGLLEGLVRFQAFHWLGLLIYVLALRLRLWADVSLMGYGLATYPLVFRYVFDPETGGIVLDRC